MPVTWKWTSGHFWEQRLLRFLTFCLSSISIQCLFLTLIPILVTAAVWTQESSKLYVSECANVASRSHWDTKIRKNTPPHYSYCRTLAFLSATWDFAHLLLATSVCCLVEEVCGSPSGCVKLAEVSGGLFTDDGKGGNCSESCEKTLFL